jgi:hypothetical protein
MLAMHFSAFTFIYSSNVHKQAYTRTNVYYSNDLVLSKIRVKQDLQERNDCIKSGRVCNAVWQYVIYSASILFGHEEAGASALGLVGSHEKHGRVQTKC